MTRDGGAVPAVRLKVCCISSAEEVRAAVRQGASALGFVSAMPSGPGVIDDELIATLIAAVPPGVQTFLLTSETDPHRIAAQERRCRAHVVQLCDDLDAARRRAVRALLPGVPLVQVVHVTGEEAIARALRAAEASDALLLDSGDPAAPVPRLGGTGRVHDWAVSRRIRDAVRLPVWLAGGLTPENVAAAVHAVAPDGVDVCSGLRTNDALDEEKLARFRAALAASPAATAPGS